ncbi:hypothetical protein ACI2L1_11730 [Streptomyces sp. NPDC019531]|uniref:hypothetical protein n=1 Tax=Streptomyces sp. NPDC019531 TaxID=3365062 RepID=UPI00384F8CD5
MRMNFAGPTQIRRSIHSARHEVMLVMPSGLGTLEEQVDLAAADSVTDISVRIYIPPTVRGGPSFPECQLTALAKKGVEIHAAPGHAPRMVIIDRSVVVLARNRADYSEGALIARGLPFTPMLVHSLTASTSLEGNDVSPDERQLDPLSREVLRQLALGSKDEVAAREMGMALRTYRRVVARLMGTLDARSRFQAGYLAARHNLR